MLSIFDSERTRKILIKDLLYHRISAYHDSNTDEVKVILDDQVLIIDSYMGDEAIVGDFQRLDLDSIIRFSADDDILTVNVTIGLCGYSYATPFDYIELYADVSYNVSFYGEENYRRTDISITNCRLALDPFY